MSDKSLTQPSRALDAKILVIGGVLGGLVGLAGAYLLAQNAQKQDKPVEISTGEAVRLAVLIFGLLRSVSTLHE